MARAIILTVDDDVVVSQAIARDLRARYSERYRIIRATSGAEALTAREELTRRGAAVALDPGRADRMVARGCSQRVGERLGLVQDAAAYLTIARDMTVRMEAATWATRTSRAPAPPAPCDVIGTV